MTRLPMEDRGGEASTSWQVYRQRTLHAAADDSAGDGTQRRCILVHPLLESESALLQCCIVASEP